MAASDVSLTVFVTDGAGNTTTKTGKGAAVEMGVTHTVTASAGANGAISPDGQTTLGEGGSQEYTITPAAHYHLDQLLLDGAPVTAVDNHDGTLGYTVSGLQADATLQVSFAVDRHTLRYTAGTNGSITGAATQTVDHGADGTAVTAVPDPHYHFTAWSDGSTANPRTDTAVAADFDVTATFAIDEVTLAVTTSGSGTVARVPDQALYAWGSAVTMTATAADGWQFAGWSGDASGTTNPMTVTMAGSRAVTATFTPITHTIIATAGVHGAIDPSGAVQVAHGDNQLFTITPDAGYDIVDVVVDDVSQGAIGEYTLR